MKVELMRQELGRAVPNVRAAFARVRWLGSWSNIQIGGIILFLKVVAHFLRKCVYSGLVK